MYRRERRHQKQNYRSVLIPGFSVIRPIKILNSHKSNESKSMDYCKTTILQGLEGNVENHIAQNTCRQVSMTSLLALVGGGAFLNRLSKTVLSYFLFGIFFFSEVGLGAILPKGATSASLSYTQLSLKGRFDQAGKAHSFGQMLQKPVFASDLSTLKNSDDLSSKKMKQGKLDSDKKGQKGKTSSRLDDSSSDPMVGVLLPHVDLDISVFTSSLMAGIESYWTFQALIPVVQVDMSLDYSYHKKTPSPSSASQKLAENQVAQENSKRIQYTSLSDVQLLNHLRLFHSPVLDVSSTLGMALPTSRLGGRSKLVGIPSDGNYDFISGVDWKFHWLRQVKSQLSMGYIVQLPDNISQEVPVSGEASESRQITFKRDSGDIFRLDKAFSCQILRSWSLTSGAGLEVKGADKLKPVAESSTSESVKGSPSEKVTLQVGAGYNGIGLASQGKKGLPVILGVSHLRTIAGKNAMESSATNLMMTLVY